MCILQPRKPKSASPVKSPHLPAARLKLHADRPPSLSLPLAMSSSAPNQMVLLHTLKVQEEWKTRERELEAARKGERERYEKKEKEDKEKEAGKSCACAGCGNSGGNALFSNQVYCRRTNTNANALVEDVENVQLLAGKLRSACGTTPHDRNYHHSPNHDYLSLLQDREDRNWQRERERERERSRSRDRRRRAESRERRSERERERDVSILRLTVQQESTRSRLEAMDRERAVERAARAGTVAGVGVVGGVCEGYGDGQRARGVWENFHWHVHQDWRDEAREREDFRHGERDRERRRSSVISIPTGLARKVMEKLGRVEAERLAERERDRDFLRDLGRLKGGRGDSFRW